MDDITLPNENDDDKILIRPIQDEDIIDLEFSKKSIPQDYKNELPTPVTPSPPSPLPGNKVTINFVKFVQLVANHSFVDVVDKNSDEEIIISSNLLTDLANAHDQGGERKTPLMFLAGIVIGVILTYVILKV
ncbi:MAG: hypothetical protein UT36_C0008G0015 [Candidatus Peregrinibacteria bacterium GW2011_GWF2_39_17]|nr:MAG: hypothetical protein UT36_C0008G0015 [Candidatus Peregrinibacteria bacterium GW2011_GWF2_39_17]HCW32053.1 hypothetical protein [Candidatus Peregrinibacteria bacterium]